MEKKFQELSLSQKSKCPIANIDNKPDYSIKTKCPFHKTIHEDSEKNGQDLVQKHGNSVRASELIADIGGGDRIRQMTTRFYARAFEDQTLSKFLFVHDCAAGHGQRLGDWIIEKMGGEGTPWSDSGRYGMRQRTHFQAWNSARRDETERGKHFKLDDCRIWMRLMFWAARDVGLHKHEIFMKFYVDFIQHFIGVYDYRAPQYAKRDAKWSKDKRNIELYQKDGFIMKDVVGIGRN